MDRGVARGAPRHVPRTVVRGPGREAVRRRAECVPLRRGRHPPSDAVDPAGHPGLRSAGRDLAVRLPRPGQQRRAGRRAVLGAGRGRDADGPPRGRCGVGLRPDAPAAGRAAARPRPVRHHGPPRRDGVDGPDRQPRADVAGNPQRPPQPRQPGTAGRHQGGLRRLEPARRVGRGLPRQHAAGRRRLVLLLHRRASGRPARTGGRPAAPGGGDGGRRGGRRQHLLRVRRHLHRIRLVDAAGQEPVRRRDALRRSAAVVQGARRHRVPPRWRQGRQQRHAVLVQVGVLRRAGTRSTPGESSPTRTRTRA